jgi:hypothetical protein
LTYESALTHEESHRKEHQRNLIRFAKGESYEDQARFTDWKKFYRQKSWDLDL